MSLGGNERSKHDINSPMKGLGNHTPSSDGFAVNNESTTICIHSPSMIIIAYFTCDGTVIGKVWTPGLGLGKSEGVVGHARKNAAQDKLFGTRGRRQE